MSKIIILGCGYIGTNIANFISEQSNENVQVVGITNEYVNYLSNKVNFVDMKIEDISKECINLFEDAIVIDALGNTDATTGAQDANIIFLRNCINKVELLKKLCNFNIKKYVFISSGGTVYSDSEIKHKEDENINPQNIYALEKTIIERYLEILGHENDKFKYLIVRLSNPYGGVISKNKRQGIIDVTIKKLRADETLEFYGDLDNIRDYIYIDDVAEYILKIAESEEKNTIFNIGSGVGISIRELFEIIERNIGKKIKLENKRIDTINIRCNVLDVEKINSKIEKNSIISIEEGIRKII